LPQPPPKKTAPTAFLRGAVIGAVGGLIGLGGAEFRLPLLIGAFGFPALPAVILNKAMSLIVVASALPFRAAGVPFASVAVHWSIIVNLLAGSLLGAWFGTGWVTKLASQTLYRVIAIMVVVLIAVILLRCGSDRSGAISGGIRDWRCCRASRGGCRQVVDSDARSLFWGGYQARGEFVARRQPTYDVGRFARYSQDRSFAVLGENRGFVLAMALGSISLGASSAANCSASFRRPHCCPN
jgi:hypothetical protein